MSRSKIVLPDKILQEKDFNPFEFWNESDAKLEELANDINQEVNQQVKLHFDGFNASTNRFSNILSGITENQKATSTMQENMADSKNLLLARNQNLKQLWLEHETLTHALEVLEKIEYVRQVPAQLQAFSSAKQYLHSVVLLQHTVELVCGDDLSEIAGLKELRDSLLMSRNTVQETLLDELLCFVYMSASTDEKTRSVTDESSTQLPNGGVRSKCATSKYSPFFENADELLKYEATDQYLRNPAGEPKIAMRLIVEALDKMHHLPSAKTQLAKTIKEQLKDIVEAELRNFRKELAYEESRRLFASSHVVGNPFAESANDNSSTKKVLAKFIAQVFGRFLNILRHHIHVTSLIHTKMHLHDPDGFSLQNEPYTIENVWKDMQVVVQGMLTEVLEPGEQELLAKHAIKQVGNEGGLSFSFSDAHAPSLAKATTSKSSKESDAMSLTSGPRSKDHQMVSFERSPYNMTIVYRPVVQFIERALAVIGKHDNAEEEEKKESLKEYLGTFITTTLLRNVTSDVDVRLSQILQDPAAFAPKEDEEKKQLQQQQQFPSSTSTQVGKPVIVMKSAIEVAHVMQKIVGYIFLLPTATDKLLDILSYVVEKFLSKCSLKYTDVSRDAYSAKCLADPALYNNSISDPAYVNYRNTVPPKHLLKLFSCDNPLYARLYTDLRLSRGDLLWDFSSWNMLTLLTETLDWLANKNFIPSEMESTKTTGGVKAGSFLSPKTRPVARRSSLSLSGTPTDVSLQVITQLGNIGSFCRKVGERALLTLRLEIHCHYFYFLSEIQHTCYFTVNEATQPDACVLELNRDLAAIDDMLTKFCSPAKINFLWSESSQLLTSIVIDSIYTLRDKRLSERGIAKLKRDLFGIQQGLAHVTVVEPEVFDHARWYIGLLDLSDEELEKTLEEEHMDERHANGLVEAITTKRPRGESRLRASRRVLKDGAAPPSVKRPSSISLPGVIRKTFG